MTHTIEQLKELCAKATPGPWQTRFINRLFQISRRDPLTLMRGDKEQDWTDSEFIAAARTCVPELIAELEAGHKTIAGVTDCVKQTGAVCAQAINAKLDLEQVVEARDKEIERLKALQSEYVRGVAVTMAESVAIAWVRIETARECADALDGFGHEAAAAAIRGKYEIPAGA